MNGLLLFTVDECSFVYYPGATIPQKGPIMSPMANGDQVRCFVRTTFIRSILVLRY